MYRVWCVWKCGASKLKELDVPIQLKTMKKSVEKELKTLKSFQMT